MFDVLNNPNHEFLRPLVTGWLAKIEASVRSRSKWKEIADECLMFYSKSAAAMWDQSYTRQFWKGVKAPKFRITINKAFELVAVFGPNLLWDVPHRTVEPKRPLEIPPELFAGNEQMAQMFQQESSQDDAVNKMTAHLMQAWLNYTPREMPGGGLIGHSEMATIDALIKGRGCSWTRPYKFPGSGRTLTGSFREPPERLLIDPDFNSLDEAKWIALQHVEPHWAVERRFKLPANSLKGRSSLESSWSFAELQGTGDKGNPHRAAGMTNDLIVWYEIWSKTGSGSRMTGMENAVKDHLEETIGDYAYVAIAADVPYPLNCPTDELRKGLTDADVKQRFSWPIPLWTDDRWPVEVLDFYPSPDSAWPIAPLAPAMGELKFLNFLIPWLANRVYSSSRDFWAVNGTHYEHYLNHLQNGEDQCVIPTPTQVADIRQAITVLQQPETRMDVWKLIELVSDQFDKRTGLTESAYGRNENGTQNRTAEETLAKKQAVGVRPEHMQKKVVEWQSRLAGAEGFLARWLITGEDVEPLMGRMGRMMWEQYIMSSDVEKVARQMSFSIAASSIRRPDRDRDVANFQQVSGLWLPVMQAAADKSGNYDPVNFLMKKFGDFHDMDMSGGFIQPAEPDPAQQQLQQQMQQAEMAATQADTELKQANTQKVIAEASGADKSMEQAAAAQKMQMEQQRAQLGIQGDAQKIQLDAIQGEQQLTQQSRQFQQQMIQDKLKAALQLKLQKKQGEAKAKAAIKKPAA